MALQGLKKTHEYVLPFYSFLVQLFYNLNLKIVHFFISKTLFLLFLSRQIDDIGKKKLPKNVVFTHLTIVLNSADLASLWKVMITEVAM